MNRIKLFLVTPLLLLLLICIGIKACNEIINFTAKGKLYSDVKSTPYREVGLLLGTNKYYADSLVSPYYANRIKAAVDLIKEGKIKYIIVSGDNVRANHNETVQMREDLIKAGVHPSVIYSDFASLRTFDSIIRLKEIFNRLSVTIISQEFHNERALFIALKEGISAIGYNAEDIDDEGWKLRQNEREMLARVKVFIDFIINEKPTYLN